jgi:hypothetical protein
MRESWTDERLDDLNQRVGDGFQRIDADIHALRAESRAEFKALRSEMKDGFERIDARFERFEDRLDERFDSLYRLMLQLGGGALVALVGLLATHV